MRIYFFGEIEPFPLIQVRGELRELGVPRGLDPRQEILQIAEGQAIPLEKEENMTSYMIVQ
jgi:hypothetical protein